jgi:predicted DNA binding protein
MPESSSSEWQALSHGDVLTQEMIKENYQPLPGMCCTKQALEIVDSSYSQGYYDTIREWTNEQVSLLDASQVHDILTHITTRRWSGGDNGDIVASVRRPSCQSTFIDSIERKPPKRTRRCVVTSDVCSDRVQEMQTVLCGYFSKIDGISL